jgi:hypothetical protein
MPHVSIMLENRFRFMLLLFAISCAFPVLALVEDVAEDGVVQKEDRTIYRPVFFERYAPQTAADMVIQIPGFVLEGADRFNNGNQARGLGQGNGNLLINGKRPSTKDNGPIAILSRISVDSVERLEILKKGSPELAGQSGQIVNIVTRENDKLTGSWQAQVHVLEETDTNPFFQGSVNGKLGSVNYTAGIDWFGNNFPQWGPEEAFDADGKLWEVREEYSSYENRGTTLNFGLAWEGNNGHIANFTLLGTSVDSFFYEDSDRYDVTSDGEQGDLYTRIRYTSDEREYNYEIGGDYTFPVKSGALKIIGLHRYRDTLYLEAYEEVPLDDSAYYFNSRTQPLKSENIIRAQYTLQPRKEHTLEFALEAVKNTLDNIASFEEDTGSGFEPVYLEGSNVKVTEQRGEASVQYSRPFGDDWTATASLGAEYSKIAADGDKPRSDSFFRPKGFLATSWAVNDETRLRGRIERSVGQLSFYDFASSTNVNEGTVNDGNTNLVPEQTWRAELTLEQQFGTNNMLTMVVFAERVDDFIVFVPFEDGAEGRGNIDKLQQIGIDITATISTDSIGISGGKFDLVGHFSYAELTDPVTGEDREHRANGYFPVHYRLSFRQDIPRTPIAWGVTLEERSWPLFYRLDQVTERGHKWPQAHRLFIEHKDVFGMTFKIETEDFFGFTYLNSRVFYEGDRNGPVSGWETSNRHSPWIVRFSLSGSF